MDLSRGEFEVLRQFARQAAGISLGDDKDYLVRQRLEPVAEAMGCADFSALCARLIRGPSPALREAVVSAIATHETSFFRDAKPFDALRELIFPWLSQQVAQRRADAGQRPGPCVNILSAGSSTGQEPYSIAISALEHARATGQTGLRPADLRIVGVDVSRTAIEFAQAGRYPDSEMARGLSAAQRDAHFQAAGHGFLVRPEVRALVEFATYNLIDPAWSLGQFDAIWCRNVLIYFDIDTKRRVLTQLCSALTPGGFLVLGSTESVYGLVDGLESLSVAGTVVYRFAPAGQESAFKDAEPKTCRGGL